MNLEIYWIRNVVKYKMKEGSVIWLRGMLCVVCGSFAVGCKVKNQSADKADYKQLVEYTEINDQVATLNKAYFNGNADEARNGLLKEVEFLNQVRDRHSQDDPFSPANQAGSIGLRIAYERLYTLEILMGNTNAASGYVEKIKNCIANDLHNGNVSSNNVSAAVSKIRPESIPNDVHKRDIGISVSLNRRQV